MCTDNWAEVHTHTSNIYAHGPKNVCNFLVNNKIIIHTDTIFFIFVNKNWIATATTATKMMGFHYVQRDTHTHTRMLYNWIKMLRRWRWHQHPASVIGILVILCLALSISLNSYLSSIKHLPYTRKKILRKKKQNKIQNKIAEWQLYNAMLVIIRRGAEHACHMVYENGYYLFRSKTIYKNLSRILFLSVVRFSLFNFFLCVLKFHK